MQLLQQIATENQAAQQRDSDLDNAEINGSSGFEVIIKTN